MRNGKRKESREEGVMEERRRRWRGEKHRGDVEKGGGREEKGKREG